MTAKKRILIILFSIIVFAIGTYSLFKNSSPKDLTQQKAARIIQNEYSELVLPYRDSLGLSDLSVSVEVEEFYGSDIRYGAVIHPYIICPSLNSMFRDRKFDDDTITKLGNIQFDVESITYDNKHISIYCFADPTFRSNTGSDYIIIDGTVIARSTKTVLYQTEKAAMSHPLAIGKQLSESTDSKGYKIADAPAANCPNCGTGFRAGTIGASMIEEYGYCSICKGRK